MCAGPHHDSVPAVDPAVLPSADPAGDPTSTAAAVAFPPTISALELHRILVKAHRLNNRVRYKFLN